MKKLVLAICLLIITQATFAQDCENYVCSSAYDLTSNISRFVSNVTGQNFLAEKIGESLTKKAIKKNITSGDIKVNLDSYSVRDLKAGRFKSLQILGRNVDFQGVYVSNFDAKTLCNYNYIAHDKQNNFYVKEDIPVGFSAELTEDDLNKTMNSSDYKRLIDNINMLGGSLNVFNITSTSVKLKNDKMYYVIDYSIPFVRKTKELVFSTNLKVNNGKLVLNNPNYVGNNSLVDMGTFSNILNYVNPLDFSAKILENKDANIKIENVNISDKKISVGGKVTILKDKE